MAAAEKETPNEGVQIVVRLDDLLHERRMTLTELAERIGITLANLSILKTGKICARGSGQTERSTRAPFLWSSSCE